MKWSSSTGMTSYQSPPTSVALTSCHVADGRLHAADLGQDLGKQGLLQDPGDAPLFAVHPTVLGCQPFGPSPPAHEVVGSEGGHDGEDGAGQGDDEGQAGQQVAVLWMGVANQNRVVGIPIFGLFEQRLQFSGRPIDEQALDPARHFSWSDSW